MIRTLRNSMESIPDGLRRSFSMLDFDTGKDFARMEAGGVVLNVLELKRIDLATEEDKRYEIDCWARMFRTGTWEELRMIAEKNKYMSEAAMAMYELNADEIIRQQCMAREEYSRNEKMMARISFIICCFGKLVGKMRRMKKKANRRIVIKHGKGRMADYHIEKKF